MTLVAALFSLAVCNPSRFAPSNLYNICDGHSSTAVRWTKR